MVISVGTGEKCHRTLFSLARLWPSFLRFFSRPFFPPYSFLHPSRGSKRHLTHLFTLSFRFLLPIQRSPALAPAGADVKHCLFFFLAPLYVHLNTAYIPQLTSHSFNSSPYNGCYQLRLPARHHGEIRLRQQQQPQQQAR